MKTDTVCKALVTRGIVSQSDFELAQARQKKNRKDGDLETIGRILITMGRIKEQEFHEIIREFHHEAIKGIKKGEEFGYILDQIEAAIGKGPIDSAQENKKATKDTSNLLVVLSKLRIATSFSQKIFIYDMFRPFIPDLQLGRMEKITVNKGPGGKISYFHDGLQMKPVYVPEIGSNFPQVLLSAEEFTTLTETKAGADHENDDYVNDLPFSVEGIVADACAQGASDIHIVPKETQFFLHFRVEGDLIPQTRYTLDLEQGRKLVKAFKGIAQTTNKTGFDADENKVVQDGRVQFEDACGGVDGRVVVIPDGRAENEELVLRIIVQKVLEKRSLEDMGYLPEHCEIIRKAFQRKNGFLLISGVTGSGKTTLAGQLLMTDTVRKWETIENPIENIIPNPNICQHQIWMPNEPDNKKSLQYLDLITGFKRGDPDGIYLGEIRREEGLVLAAIEAAYAGQTVMSTFHIRNAFEVFEAFKEVFGLDHYTMASLIHYSHNQSLVKTLCDCKQVDKEGKNRTELNKIKDELSYIVKDELNDFLDGDDETFIRNPDGCEKCGGKGYRGRTVLYEFLYPTVAFKKILKEQKLSSYDIETRACKDLKIGINKLQVFIMKLKLGVIDVSPATVQELM